jgi:hypothetical protein
MTTALRRLSCALATVLLAGLLSACNGENCFTANCQGPNPNPGDTTGVQPAADTVSPGAQLQFPRDSATVAVADSVFVQVRVTDNLAVGTVELSGFALRGDPNLGTQQRVDRFQTKTVDLSPAAVGRAVKDTVVTRYLLASADSLPEKGVFVVATVRDTAGHVRADTVPISIGGPRIQIMSPASAAEFRGGTTVPVRILAEDRIDLVASVRIRASGAFAADTTLTLRVPAASVDTVVVFPVPITAQGGLHLEATTTSGSRLAGTARPVDVTILSANRDETAPRVSFTVQVVPRAETKDTLYVGLSASDETRVDTVGATVFAIHRTATGEDTLVAIRRKLPASAGTVKFALEEFSTARLPFDGLDTVTIAFEVTAFAKDGSNNCATATAPGAVQSLPCRPGPAGTIVADGPGRLQNVLVTRGLTIPPPNPGDVLPDLVADSSRLYISNLTRNRVDVLPIGGMSYGVPARVGSEPWGLAISRFRDSLYVANSGGTNISVIPLKTATFAEAEGRRIFTANERLYSVTGSFPGVSGVTEFDYSDRPQFIAQASNGLLVYSTKPTQAAGEGTVRIFDQVKLRSEIFIGYVDRHTANKAVVVNADSAFWVPPTSLMVCPRKRSGDTSDPQCIVGNVVQVEDSLAKMRALPPNASGAKYDTRVDIGADIAEVGFSDTTYVAASGDRNYVAVGEGGRVDRPARIPMFRASGDSLLLQGDIRDLISNAAERVIGLGINRDGSLSIARGNQAYFFFPTLRLQGVVESGSPTGGVAMHPEGAGYPGGSNRLAFVSGLDAQGPYVDVIDTFNFFRIKRLYIRDPVVGALAVAPRAPSDPGNVVLRLYALTPRGIVALQVTTADLAR